jgi:MmyB-like transcription regulator ligand binding domain/Helix-turn-helix domain
VVDNRSEIRQFLTSRRARISPEQVGIPAYGSRRVAGLRRGEVAALAGVSVEYYTRLERGNLGGVSDSVLEALSRALQLDDTERAHLWDLARTSTPAAAARARRRTGSVTVRPSVQHLLAAMTGTPAFVRNNRFDVLAANSLGRALYAPMFTATPEPVNTARFIFLDHRAPGFFLDWERVARDSVGALRVEAGRNPHDRELSNLIGELSTRNDQFGIWWGAHDVYIHRHATKRFRHPLVGEIELAVETMPLSGDTGQTLVAYSAEPGTAAEDSLKLLANWAAPGDDKDAVEAGLAD